MDALSASLADGAASPAAGAGGAWPQVPVVPPAAALVIGSVSNKREANSLAYFTTSTAALLYQVGRHQEAHQLLKEALMLIKAHKLDLHSVIHTQTYLVAVLRCLEATSSDAETRPEDGMAEHEAAQVEAL